MLGSGRLDDDWKAPKGWTSKPVRPRWLTSDPVGIIVVSYGGFLVAVIVAVELADRLWLHLSPNESRIVTVAALAIASYAFLGLASTSRMSNRTEHWPVDGSHPPVLVTTSGPSRRALLKSKLLRRERPAGRTRRVTIQPAKPTKEARQL